MPRTLGASTQKDDHWRQRIKKEEARAQVDVTKPDPFAKSLSTLLHHHEQPQAIKGKIATEAKRAGEAPTRSAEGASKPRDGSQLSTISARQSSIAPRTRALPDDTSDLGSAMSYAAPSSIRSSEPSTIARNKIAELQLRLELERVMRLEKETALEAERLRDLKGKRG